MSKKLIAIALAGIFALSIVAPAKADTLSDLQAQITALMAQIAALQGQQSTGMVCFNTDLKLGMKSDDVKNLQIKLGVTPTSGYFGPITKAAVKAFQTTNGIISTGYVGPLTRAALNTKYCTPPVTTPTTAPTTALPAGCTSAVGFSPTTGLPCAGTTTTTVGPSYGTLSVVSYPVSNPQTTWYGANTYEVVAGQYKATGSDITVKKVAIKTTSDTATAFPWQAFTTISVWDGATKLAELPVISANAIETTFGQIYTFNISGFNLVIPNGQQKVLTVKVTTVANPPTAVTTASFWKFDLLTDVVYTDTAGVTYSTVTGSAVTLDNVTLTSSQQATLTVTSATDNPLAGNVIGSTSATTKVDVLKFNIKAENVNSTLTSGTIKVTDDGSIVKDAYVTSLELWDGSTLVAAAAPSGWASDVGTSSWTGFSLPISAGTTKTLTVKAVLAQLPTTYTGASTGYLQITTGPTLTGIDANSNIVTNSTTVTGNKMYPFLVAPTFAYVTSTATVRGSATGKSDLGDTAITFSVTANGGDIYIPTVGNTTTTKGIDEVIIPAYAVATKAYSTSTTWTCSSPSVSSVDTDGTAGQVWRIPSGATANCSFSTLVTNTNSGTSTTTASYFNVAVEHVRWYTSATTTAASYINQSWGFTNIQTADFYLGN